MADDHTTFVDRNNMTRHTKCAIRNHKSNQVVLAVDDYYYLAGTQRLLLGFQFLILSFHLLLHTTQPQLPKVYM